MADPIATIKRSVAKRIAPHIHRMLDELAMLERLIANDLATDAEYSRAKLLRRVLRSFSAEPAGALVSLEHEKAERIARLAS